MSAPAVRCGISGVGDADAAIVRMEKLRRSRLQTELDAHLAAIKKRGFMYINPSINEALFVKTSERINGTLHEGAVDPNERAEVVSALLLSMLRQSGPQIEERDTSLLVHDIDNRAARILQQQGKQSFEDHIRLPLPAAEDNHVKLRRALVETLQDLRGLNIHSAMKSGADQLGTFYEVFLKYARWAHDLGIVMDSQAHHWIRRVRHRDRTACHRIRSDMRDRRILGGCL